MRRLLLMAAEEAESGPENAAESLRLAVHDAEEAPVGDMAASLKLLLPLSKLVLRHHAFIVNPSESFCNSITGDAPSHRPQNASRDPQLPLARPRRRAC
jgi:hypothetical protein